MIDRKRPRTQAVVRLRNPPLRRRAELQLPIVPAEILERFDGIEVMDEPKRVYSSFIKGYEHLPVRIAA